MSISITSPLLEDATSGVFSAWDDLHAAIRGPIESFEWWQACVEGLAGVGQGRPLLVYDRGKCAAIAPLALRPGILPRLESIGVRQLYEPMDFVYSTREALAMLCDTLAQQSLPVDLPRVPRESPLLDELRRACRGRGWVLTSSKTPYPVLELKDGWTVETHFNAGRHSDFRRAMRKAEQAGNVEFEVVVPQPSSLQSLLAQAYDIESRGWKGRKGSALASDPTRAEFYRRYFRACCTKGVLRLAFMRIGGVPIAMQIDVQTDRKLWLLKIGYDETYSRLSPGTLLMLHVARFCARDGIRAIEFLGSVEPWTRIWANGQREMVHIRVYPTNFLGAAVFVVDAVERAKRRLWRR